MLTDTLIIGSGIAGAAAALRLSDDPRHRITILTRAADAHDSNTHWAQGGIVTRGIADSAALLIADILAAGDGLSSPQAAAILAEEGPALVQSVLVERCGVRFDRESSGEPVYGLEAAHSTRRIVHVGDRTGQTVMRQLLHTLAQRPNITLLTGHTAIDLLTDNGACTGAAVLESDTGRIMHIHAAHTILATGGLGQLYQYTSNPPGARGDGIAMAHRAGARIENIEYVQFHPTALLADEPMKPLVSEAVRGEGGILLTPDGRRFMAYHAPGQMELAPRDVVARAIHHEMQAGGFDHVLLDIASQRPARFIRERFPALVENVARLGLDATRDPLPVIPVAHYACGGVHVDCWGHTTVPGLYAVGEVSCTGLHGANRLASTSLLEGLVWGDRAARRITRQPRQTPPDLPTVHAMQGTASRSIDLAGYWQTLRGVMWQHAGISRTATGLAAAADTLIDMAQSIARQIRGTHWTDDLIGLRNAVDTARLIVSAARHNPVSRGAHFRADTLETITLAEHTS